MSNLKKILALLPGLTSAERGEVGLRLKMLDALGPYGNEPAPVDDYLLEGIHSELRRRGLLGLEARLPLDSVASFRRQSANVRALLESRISARLDNAHRSALGMLAIRALADYLEKRHTPVTHWTLPKRIASVPAAIEEAFPGYLGAGLIPFIWNKKNAGRNRAS